MPAPMLTAIAGPAIATDQGAARLHPMMQTAAPYIAAI